MPETRDLASVLAAAEHSAASGDYTSAEQHLRDAAWLQEVTLGPVHPDLANTLNNLGIVCEMAGKPDDAERCFRSAYEIATTAFEPDHPFVATSRKNLEDFCREHNVPVDLASPLADPAKQEVAATLPDEVPVERFSVPPPPPFPLERRSRTIAMAGIAVGVLLALIAGAFWLVSREAGAPSAAGAPPPVQGAPAASGQAAAPVAAAPRETAASGSAAARDPRTLETPSTAPRAAPPPSPPASPPPPKSAAAPTAAVTPPVVVEALLCRSISTGADWRCIAPTPPIGPGLFIFYTRLRSPVDMTVEHRWYRNGRLSQSVELPIRANRTGGFRTYSRNTVDGQEAGEWRVELRSSDGALLHEERFVVQ
jgi:hypothetical protein